MRLRVDLRDKLHLRVLPRSESHRGVSAYNLGLGVILNQKPERNIVLPVFYRGFIRSAILYPSFKNLPVEPSFPTLQTQILML